MATNGKHEPEVRILAPAEGDATYVLGVTVNRKVSTEETGKFCVATAEILPGAQIPLHLHPDAEVFHVLDGELDVGRMVGGSAETRTLKAGETAYVASNAIHAFRNATGKPVRVLIICEAGLERFFVEAGIPVDPANPPQLAPPSPAEIERTLAIAMKHGQQFLPPA